MNDQTRIILARHGETFWNRQQRLQGQKDSPLTPVGREQATNIREKLGSIEINDAYVSPLKRAVDTIQIILEDREVEPIPVDGLMEIALGPWEGVTKEETRLSHPHEYRNFWLQPEFFSLNGAETYSGLQKRVVDQLKKILISHTNHTTLVVSHWIAIKTALAFFTSTPLSRLSNLPDLENGGFVNLIYESGKVKVK